jgi:chromosome segregation ATPase
VLPVAFPAFQNHRLACTVLPSTIAATKTFEMDTPRTNLGDATYLDRHPPDFDMTQEPSFQSPSKDNNLVQQLRNGRAVNLRTPRGSRAPLGDKRNLPAGIGGAEFTPMLKSATRNSARRRGKENTNGLATPALGKIDEDMDMTNVPVESSLFGPSRNMSYVEATPLPEVTASSTTSTPMVLPTRRGGSKGPLQDGNQLSLREQENVIDKIEKENFGLKLKIHFLEEALRKTGPGFSEAALQENTELKVDKVTMQRELSKYKKHLASAEKDLETYQKQILEVQERAKKKYADQSQKAENDALRRRLEDREAEIENLQRQLQQSHDDAKVGDLEAALRTKDREINDREDDIDELRTRLKEMEERWESADERNIELEKLRSRSDERAGEIEDLQEKVHDLEANLREKDIELGEQDKELNELEDKLNKAEVRIAELEETPQLSEELAEAKETIEQLQGNVRRLEQQIGDMRDDLQLAISDKDRAEGDLQELQEEMSNKSVMTKGLSRQVEEKIARLQTELNRSQEKYNTLERQGAEKEKFSAEVKARAEQLLEQRKSWENERHGLMSQLEAVRNDLRIRTDEKNLLQLRHDALGDESASLQRDIARLQRQVTDLEDSLEREKTLALQMDRETKRLHELEVERLNSDITDLQEEIQLVRRQASGGQSASASLEREVSRLQKRVSELEKSLEQEKAHSIQSNKDVDNRHRSELKRLQDDIADLQDENERLRQETSGGQSASASFEREIARLQNKTAELERDLEHERANARVRQNTLGDETASLQREITRLRNQVSDLELSLDQEKSHGLQVERDTRSQLKSEIDRLNDEVSDLQAEIRENENRYESDSEKWQVERRDLESQRDRLEDRATGLQRTIERLRDAEGTLSSKEMKLQDALNSETERHKSEEAALSRQIDNLRRDLEARQSTLTDLRNEISMVRDDLRKSELECQAQADTIEALEDEVEVLQATLDEESEDASRKLREADELCQDLRRQLELSKREQVQRADRLDHLEDADRIAERLRQQLDETKQKLYVAERECEDLKRKVDEAGHQQSREITQANRATDDLKRQLARAQKDSKKAQLVCDDLRSQLDAARQDLDYANPLCQELRQKLDRVRSERAAYQASAAKLQVDCERLKKGAQEALAWIQAKNAQQPNSTTSVMPATIKKAAMATFRYGDVVMDVVDQKDHEAVIRAADSAQRRHEKEIRGMALQMEWMQARWERESKLRNDSAFAKKFLQLQLDIADAWYVLTLFPCHLFASKPILITATATKQISVSSTEFIKTSGSCRLKSFCQENKRLASVSTISRSSLLSSGLWLACRLTLGNGVSTRRRGRGWSPRGNSRSIRRCCVDERRPACLVFF